MSIQSKHFSFLIHPHCCKWVLTCEESSHSVILMTFFNSFLLPYLNRENNFGQRGNPTVLVVLRFSYLLECLTVLEYGDIIFSFQGSLLQTGEVMKTKGKFYALCFTSFTLRIFSYFKLTAFLLWYNKYIFADYK